MKANYVHKDSLTATGYDNFVKTQSIKESILRDTKDYGRTQFVDEIYRLQQENENLKQKLNWIAFGDDPELALRYLRKIGYVDFDNERKVYINKHVNDSFLCENEEEKDYYIKDEELDEYTQLLIYKNKKLEDNWNKLFQWLTEQEEKAWDEASSVFGEVLNKMKELEEEV